MTAHLGSSVTQLSGKSNSGNFIMLFITLHMLTVSKIWNCVMLCYQRGLK